MDYILEKYKPLVRKKTNALYLIGGENDDLIQEGMIGLPLINIILMAGFFCITRISGTSHKIGRNFSQDLPHLVTRYQASRFLASFYVLFCGHIPLPVGNMPLPKNCPKNPSEVSASPQTACSWAFRLKDWLLKFFSRVFILSAGIYVFSAMAVYFPASSEFSPCTCVLFTFRPLGTLKNFFSV